MDRAAVTAGRRDRSGDSRRAVDADRWLMVQLHAVRGVCRRPERRVEVDMVLHDAERTAQIGAPDRWRSRMRARAASELSTATVTPVMRRGPSDRDLHQYGAATPGFAAPIDSAHQGGIALNSLFDEFMDKPVSQVRECSCGQ